MNILFLAYEPPYPPNDGGRIRTFNILKRVAKKHQVTLVAFINPTNKTDYSQILGGICQNIFIFPRPKFPKRGHLQKITGIFRRYPFNLKRFFSAELVAYLQNKAVENRFDIVHIDQIYLSQYVDAVFPLPCLQTHHNVEAEGQRRVLLQNARYYHPRWWLSWLEHLRWQRFEIDISRKMQALVTVSERDALYFRQRVPGVKTFAVPNGVDTDFFIPNGNNKNNENLLFTGRMDYAPNIDAVIWFSKEILPLIRHAKPLITFTIVGRDPVPDVEQLKQIPGITITGEVPDTRPYYSESTIYVAPIRTGSGTRLKILEAMAMQMPIVSTTLGAEGLEINPGMDIIIADEPKDFADKVVQLLNEDSYRQDVSYQARQKALNSYSWDAIVSLQEQAYTYVFESKVC